MKKQILSLFPPHTHPLTLVSDPDRLLAGEILMVELAQRGFQVIQEDDPVLLRYRVEEARPWTVEHPLILSTAGALEDLPYDLYQPAYRIRLSLHQYFPNLAYPVLQTLSPEQIEVLETCQPPDQTLSRQKTIEYLLHTVFGADPVALSQPHALVAWLNDYHHRASRLPELLQTSLIERLKVNPEYQAWNVGLLIRDAQAFQDFVQQQWQLAIERSVGGGQIKESAQDYAIPFHRDPQFQDLVPGLVRQGTVRPVRIEATQNLPYWAQPGVTRVDARLQRITALSAELDHRLSGMETGPETHLSWNTWEEFARDWAELCGYLTQTDLEILTAQKMAYQELVRRIDPLFAAWLGKNYTPLGSLRLPSPHHVHHIPHYLAYQRALGKLDKAILLVLDGLSLGDWQVIHFAWGKRHVDWHFKNEVLLAQIPTITSISRYALISGLRPADFAGEIDHNYSEARAWELCWSREGVGESTCKLISLAYDRQIDQMPELQDPRINFWCLIDDTLDKLVHHASLGAADQQSSLRLWLDPSQEQNSAPLEALIGMYLNQGFSVFIASDHGHVEASGFGQPSEGLLVQTRGKRARIYTDVLAALRVQNAFADTILWEKDGLLPDQMTVLMPARREAFAPAGEVVVTHGGISIDEAIVPFIQISKESQ